MYVLVWSDRYIICWYNFNFFASFAFFAVLVWSAHRKVRIGNVSNIITLVKTNYDRKILDYNTVAAL